MVQDRVESLRADVIAFGRVVETRLRRALTAVDTFDTEMATAIIDGDAEINQRYLDLEGECIDCFALSQPVAGDLRLVTASFKILTDLERIADLAVNLAALAETLVADGTGETFAAVPLVEIGEFAAAMLDDALHAFAEGDTELCKRVVDRDDRLNEQCSAASDTIIRNLVEYSVDEADSPIAATPAAAREVLVLVRDLERVGDHAANIAARTYYLEEFDDALLY